MNTLWTTLIEINLILSIVYFGYVLLLKNLTFFRWTRLYLLVGMLTGLVYPFLKTQQVIKNNASGLNIVIPELTELNVSKAINYELWATYLVLATFLVLSIRFLIRFYSLNKIHTDSRDAEFNGEVYRNTNLRINPFSFWKWIYIHRDSHSDFEMKQIITHEHIHTRERHTLDVLVAEICTIVCWYNPLIKLLNKAVKDNLEFLVDAEVLQAGIDKTSYQHSLVGISLSGLPQPLHGNQFAFKTLKRRIKMMNQTQSSRYRLLSFALLAPAVIAAASLLTFSCQKETLDLVKNGEIVSLVKEAEIQKPNPSSTADSLTQSESNSPIAKNTIDIKVTANKENTSEFKGVQLGFETSGDVMDEQKEEYVLINPTTNVFIKGSTDQKESPLLFLDGKPFDDLNSLKPNDIESISVFKDQSAIEKYGEKAKNGVILITTKSSARR
jgi:TonB-dependent SusC/RagA subfamily outer membrane receptor